MRTLAIDPGSRRIGLAISDDAARLAMPYEVVAANPAEHAIARILHVISSEGVQRLVVGLPLNMDDSRGPAAESAIRFGKLLSSRAGLPALFVDERLSSFQAEQEIAQRRRGGEKITRQGKKDRLDALAASIFLQAFLDGKLTALSE